jgi:hypothetical protein
MQVWDCGKEAIWVQKYKVCQLIMGKTTPTQASSSTTAKVTAAVTTSSPSMTTTTGGQLDANICKNSTSFYHPHPFDNTKFIQCDDFGKIYIRKCGELRVWNDYHKTCALQSGPDQTTQKSGSSKTNKPMQSTTTPPIFVSPITEEIKTTGDEDVSVSIDETVFISDLNDMCPPNSYFDRRLRTCIPQTATHSKHRSRRTVSKYGGLDNSCPPGFTWNPNWQVHNISAKLYKLVVFHSCIVILTPL